MTPADLIAFRKQAGLTQTELAVHLDMSLRAVQDIENGRSKLRQVHEYAVERLSLRLAAGLKNPSLILPSVAKDMDDLVR